MRGCVVKVMTVHDLPAMPIRHVFSSPPRSGSKPRAENMRMRAAKGSRDEGKGTNANHSDENQSHTGSWRCKARAQRAKAGTAVALWRKNRSLRISKRPT